MGFVVTDDGLLPLPGTSLRIVAPGVPNGSDSGVADTGIADTGIADTGIADSSLADTGLADSGIVGWVLSGVVPANDVSDVSGIDVSGSDVSGIDVSGIDGLVTSVIDPPPPVFGDHSIGALGLDHVVVMTPDLERTSEAIAAATGCELKRIREVGSMRQGFHRIGPGGLIVELVERPEVPEGPASFWGLVVNVEDLDAACALIGTDRVSAPRDAVQPGRRIATLRNEVGLGLPVALMTP